MRVLFVSSGNSGDVGVLVKNQAESLIKEGIDIDFFLIKGKGFWGYMRNIKGIRHKFLSGNYDLIHAHYSLSAFAASLAGRFPLVVSLMGSDTYLSGILRIIVRLFYYISWDITIVKTVRMKNLLRMKRAVVLPNGVDTDKYMSIPKDVARKRIKYNKPHHKLIVFVADPQREEKNFALALEAFNLLKLDDVELLPVYNKPNDLIPYYMNAADMLLLTSKWEGGVNVVKEALACNLPVVSTDVGDVKENIKGVLGCYICECNPEDIASKIREVISNPNASNGRERIFELKLDTKSVSNRIISLYQICLAKTKRLE
jgi:glycosyltransferase involved in cell wall biosynthesis